LILAIEIPKPLPSFARFYKISKRRLDDISTLAAGFSVDLETVLSPIGDHRGSAHYRREAAKSLFEKFLWEYETAA